MNILQLSEEMLLKVLSYLKWKEIANVSLVSTIFERLCTDDVLTKGTVITVDLADDAHDEKKMKRLREMGVTKQVGHLKITDKIA
jgi:hypothetical protein